MYDRRLTQRMKEREDRERERGKGVGVCPPRVDAARRSRRQDDRARPPRRVRLQGAGLLTPYTLHITPDTRIVPYILNHTPYTPNIGCEVSHKYVSYVKGVRCLVVGRQREMGRRPPRQTSRWSSKTAAPRLTPGCRSTPYTLHPAPYTLHPTPYTLHITPYTLHIKIHLNRHTPYV